MLSFGQLFGSNFWSSFKSQPSESIEKLIKNPHTSIEDLLDDSDLIQECKNGNKNLMSYLTRDKIKELINFITVMPEEDEHNRGHKYPFLASEVFSCDMSEVIEKFFTAPCDDSKPEADEHHDEDEDATKIESTFEKDNDDSGSDSEEELPMHAVNDNKDEHQDQKSEENPDSNNSTESKEEEPSSVAVSIESEGLVSNVIQVQSDVEAEITEQLQHPAKTHENESHETPEVSKQTELEHPASEVKENQDAPETHEEEKSEEKHQETSCETPQTQDVSHQKYIEDDDTVISEATTEISARDTKKSSSESNKYDLIDYLTKFIDTNEELNDVLAGYFSRLCNLLIQKKGEEMALYFYTNKHKLLRFADHSYSKSISEIAVKILDINVDKLDFDKAEITKIRIEFLNRLLMKLKEDKPEICTEYSLNIFQIFSDLTYKKAMNDGANLIKYYDMLIEQNILNTLGEILLIKSPECNSIAAIRIINVLISHLRDHLTSTSKAKQTASEYLSDDESVLVKETPEESEAAQDTNKIIATHPLVEFIKSQVIDNLIEQLEIPPENGIQFN